MSRPAAAWPAAVALAAGLVGGLVAVPAHSARAAVPLAVPHAVPHAVPLAIPRGVPHVVIEQPGARIDLAAVSPVLLDPRATLTVTGTITNTGAVPLEMVGARLRLVRQGLGGRAGVAAWDDGSDKRTGTVVGPTLDVQPRSIAVGARAPFSLVVPANELGLAGQRFGAYGLSVEVRAQGEVGRQQVGLLRTSVQWQPGRKEYAAQQIAWLVPITGLPVGTDGAPATPEQLAVAVGPGSRLRRVLDAAAAPGVGWAVDPALLQTLNQAATPVAPGASTDPTPTPAPMPTGPGPSAVVAGFVADLRAAAAGRTVIELPYADPDLSAVTAGGRTDLVRAAQAAGAGIAEQVLGVTPVTGVAWPADGWAGQATLGAVSEVGVTDVVLDARSRRLVDPLPYTADARADLPDGVTGWLVDPALAGLVAAGSADVPALQRLYAETAAATSERPGLTRRLLVTAPRGFNPDPVAFRALVQATASVPWLSVVPVTDLRRAPPGSRTDATADLPRLDVGAPAAVNRAQLSSAHLAAVRRTRGALSALGEVLERPAVGSDALQRSTLELLSCSWRGQPDRLARERATVARSVSALTDQLRVLPSSVNFLTSSGRLQITVTSGLDNAVTGLRLRVSSTNPRLRVTGGDVAIPDLAPGTRAQVQVPVQALGSGKVLLNAQLVSPSGRPLGQLEQVSVRAQPTGTWALSVVGGIVALVLVVGLVRALRRPRRARGVTGA